MKYDVVVVGAGPAGATAAKCLAEKGISVLLLDRQKFPRGKPCGGGLPARILKRYPYIEKNHLVDSKSFTLCFHSSSLKYNIQIGKPEPIIAMVLRPTFDAGLVSLASQAGAQFLDGHRATHVKTQKDSVQLTLNDGTTIDASYVIAADGMWGSVTKHLGVHQENRNVGMCVVEEYPVSSKIMNHFFGEQRCIHFHVNVFGIAGYGWVFPKREHVNIGLCEFRHAIDPGREKKNLRALYGQYLSLLKNTAVIPQDLQIQNLRGGAFPTVPIERTYGMRTLICGDAAGLVNPLTGEGIYSAMISGELASATLVNALESGNAENREFSSYERRWMKEFGNDHKRFFRLSKGLQRDAEDFIRIIEKDPMILDIAVRVLIEPIELKKIRGKIMRRILLALIKDRLGLAR
jgi:geranylgeranyl reductase family protein